MIDVDMLRFPWLYPVTLTQGNFKGLHQDSHMYNVQVAKEQFPGRYHNLLLDKKKRSGLKLGYADMQTTFGSPLIMLGSGRSLFYNGKYLKGVGVTPLSNKWDIQADPYHGSGHLLPSGGIRELLISDYIHSLRMDHIIVPCTDILLGKSCLNRAKLTQKIYERVVKGRMPLIDKNLSAITVKDDGFCRYSNILWYLAHQAEDNLLSVADLSRIILNQRVENLSPKDQDKLSLDEIVVIFKNMLERGFINLMESTLNGVIWGSINNNFTLDGRFLDLELPLVFDGPMFGKVLGQRYLDPNPLKFEAFHYIAEIRKFIVYLKNTLQTFSEIQQWSKSERAKKQAQTLDYFINCIDEVILKKSIIFNDERLIEFVYKCVREYSDSSFYKKKDLFKIIQADLSLYCTGDSLGKKYEARSRKLKQSMELGTEGYSIHLKKLNLKTVNPNSEKEFANALQDIESSADVEDALRKVKCYRKSIRSIKKVHINLADRPWIASL
jgi:hypothetical protein